MNRKKVKGESKIYMIPVYQITENKSQPRKTFYRDDIRYLAKSIELNGIIQPLIVRDISPFEYELISGERRLRAAVMAGLRIVPCIIIHCNKKQSAVYTLLESFQKKDLSYFEQAEAIDKLVYNYNFSIETVSKQLGKSESSVRNKLNLLSLTVEERRLLVDHELPEQYAVLLLRIPDSDTRTAVLYRIIDENLSLYEAEEYIQEQTVNTNNLKKSRRHIVIKDIRLFYNTINKAVSTMRESGVEATKETTETEDFVEFKIRIPK